MKRYCLLLFLLLLALFPLNADRWNSMKELILSWLHSPKADFQELSNGYDEELPYAAWDFQVDKWRYTILSKEDRTVSVHPILYVYWPDTPFIDYAWTPDTTLTGTVEIPSHVTYNDTVYTVTTITESAFFLCVTIDSLIIPETITKIEDYAFTQSFIKSYTFLGSHLNEVGDVAFMTDSEISSDGIIHRHCYMYCEKPPKGTVFLTFNEKEPNGLLHVPVGCKEVYQQAEGWSKYGDNIVDDIELEGIHNSKFVIHHSDAPAYDLQGRRVAHPKQGEIYIQDGKKYINK